MKAYEHIRNQYDSNLGYYRFDKFDEPSLKSLYLVIELNKKIRWCLEEQQKIDNLKNTDYAKFTNLWLTLEGMKKGFEIAIKLIEEEG